MSQVTLTPDEFADLVMVFLLDTIKNDAEYVDNEQFKEFIHFLDKRGGKAELLPKYLKMDAKTRVKYKRLDAVLKEKASAVRINVQDPDVGVVDKIDKKAKEMKSKKKGEKIDKGLVAKIFKKVKEVRFKTSKPITEERLYKIIDYVEAQNVKEQQEEEENG